MLVLGLGLKYSYQKTKVYETGMISAGEPMFAVLPYFEQQMAKAQQEATFSVYFMKNFEQVFNEIFGSIVI